MADNVLDRYSPRTQEPNTKIPAMHDRVKYTNASLKTIVKILLQIKMYNILCILSLNLLPMNDEDIENYLKVRH